jgi:exosortase/archaeosortase family protein
MLTNTAWGHLPFGPDEQTELRRRRIPVWIYFSAVVAIVGIPLATPYSRDVEAHIVAWLERLLGVSQAKALAGGRVLVVGRTSIIANVTTSCSGLPLALIISALAIGVSGPKAIRRARNAVLAFLGVYAFNIFRVMTTVYLGSKLGLDPMIVFHDWAGTSMTIASGVTAVLLLVRSIAASDSSLPGSPRFEASAS